jgi:hypothetical protein
MNLNDAPRLYGVPDDVIGAILATPVPLSGF